MKRITLRNTGNNQSLPTFKLVAGHSPQGPLTVPEIRARVKVLDALDRADGDSLVLEDAEWQTLRKCVETFPWQQAQTDLLEIIDDVLDAKSVSAAHLHAVPAVPDPEDDSGRGHRVGQDAAE